MSQIVKAEVIKFSLLYGYCPSGLYIHWFAGRNVAKYQARLICIDAKVGQK